jgi:hypothetical protein
MWSNIRLGLGRHDPNKARRGLGSGRTTVFTLRAGTARPRNFLGFAGPNPFGTKHDGLGPGPIPSTTPIVPLHTCIARRLVYHH